MLRSHSTTLDSGCFEQVIVRNFQDCRLSRYYIAVKVLAVTVAFRGMLSLWSFCSSILWLFDDDVIPFLALFPFDLHIVRIGWYIWGVTYSEDRLINANDTAIVIHPTRYEAQCKWFVIMKAITKRQDGIPSDKRAIITTQIRFMMIVSRWCWRWTDDAGRGKHTILPSNVNDDPKIDDTNAA